MLRTGKQVFVAIACLLSLAGSGCSTLGLSLYPSGATLTKESKAVLNASRIPSAIPRENFKSVLPPHALEPGDALVIELVSLERDLRLPADQVVLADGTVDLGPYGRVVVAGRNLEQTESLIEQQIVHQLRNQAAECKQFVSEDARATIEKQPLPQDCDAIAVNVRLLEPVHRFYVLGEVNAPGAYPLTGSETVLDAIVGAGGLTASANPCQILLARPTDPCECRVTLPVCYREIVQMGNTATNYQLQPGDRVFVATRSCLDELMFWRASRPCERCCGCNRACRNPQYLTAKPMAMVQDSLIPPGSVGWTRPDDDLLGPNDLIETHNEQGQQQKRFDEHLSHPVETLRSNAPEDDADIDGELEFSPLPR